MDVICRVDAQYIWERVHDVAATTKPHNDLIIAAASTHLRRAGFRLKHPIYVAYMLSVAQYEFRQYQTIPTKRVKDLAILHAMEGEL
jgi:hypothetical protein